MVSWRSTVPSVRTLDKPRTYAGASQKGNTMPAQLKRLLLPLAGLVAALAVIAPSAALAEPATTVQLDGVRTTLTTNPATTSVLISHGVLPLPVGPATVSPVWSEQGFSLGYGFPITNGRVDATTLAGYVNHSGGLRFVNVANGHSLTLTNFQIVISATPGLTAEVNNNPNVRVRILNLDLSHAGIVKQPPRVTVSDVKATLTTTAATALNSSLGVAFFAPGITLGIATVNAHLDLD